MYILRVEARKEGAEAVEARGEGAKREMKRQTAADEIHNLDPMRSL